MMSRTLPWISNDVRNLMRARNNCCAIAKKSKKTDDWMKHRRLRNQVVWELEES